MRPSKRDELVQKALKSFYQGGFHATGMDKLVADSGISKTSMYKHFRTKEDLILAALRLRDEQFRNWLFRWLDDHADNPRDKLIGLFDALALWFAEPDFSSCMFIKASGEYPDPSHPIHALSAEHKRLLYVHFRDLAAQAGATEPETLARQLMLAKEGAIVVAHLGASDAPAEDAKQLAITLIDAAIKPKP